MADRPGTMIYFDDFIHLLDEIDIRDTGLLFRAIIYYGRYGEIPDFSSQLSLRVAWSFIRPKIDRDAAKYEQEIIKRRYATYCREEKKKGNAPLPFNEWCHVMSHDSTWDPTGKTTETEISSGTASTTGDGGGMEEQAVNQPPPPPSRAEEYFRKMINANPTISSMYQLRDFETELGTEVCCRAIDVAVDENKRSWSYIRAILQAKLDAGIKSLEDWNRAEIQRKDAKAKRTVQEEPVDGYVPYSDSDNEAVFRELEALGVSLSGGD